MKFKLAESILFEGTHYNRNAEKILVDSGLFDESESRDIIDGLFKSGGKNRLHVFTGDGGNLVSKMLIGIARMITEVGIGGCKKYPEKGKESAEEFINDVDVLKFFNDYLTFVKDSIINGSIDQNERARLIGEFNNKLSYDELEHNYYKMVKSKAGDESKNQSNQVSDSKGVQNNSKYKIVPIESYEQLNSTYGGALTGNGTGDSSAWCHTNGEWVYDIWVHGGDRKFYVLEKDGYKDINFDEDSNDEFHGRDDYGHSLMAILVDINTGALLNVTLRCNHEGVRGSADNQYKTYGELKALTGLDVEKLVMDNLKVEVPQDDYYDFGYRDDLVFLLSEDEINELGSKRYPYNFGTLVRTSGKNIDGKPLELDKVGYYYNGKYNFVDVEDDVNAYPAIKCVGIDTHRIKNGDWIIIMSPFEGVFEYIGHGLAISTEPIVTNYGKNNHYVTSNIRKQLKKKYNLSITSEIKYKVI